jgi:hypothetical protein
LRQQALPNTISDRFLTTVQSIEFGDIVLNPPAPAPTRDSSDLEDPPFQLGAVIATPGAGVAISAWWTERPSDRADA